MKVGGAMYKIRISYETGDSFYTEYCEDTIEYEFEKLETANENLERIREHYEMYENYGRSYVGSYKELRKEYGERKWFVDKKDRELGPFIALHSLNLVLDNGKEFRYSCFWCGYFEQLYGASIEESELPSFSV